MNDRPADPSAVDPSVSPGAGTTAAAPAAHQAAAGAAAPAAVPFGPPYGPPFRPVYGPPRPPRILFRRAEAEPTASRLVLAGAVMAGLVASLVLATDRLGVNLFLTGLVVAAAAWPAARRRLDRPMIAFGVLALLLLGVVAIRDASWVWTLCALLAFPLASYALAGGRTWPDVLLGGVAVPLAGLQMPPWVWRGLRQTARSDRNRLWPIVRTAAVAIALLVVFGALFSGADAAFGRIVATLLPDLSLTLPWARIVLFVMTAGLALAAAFLATAPPQWQPGPSAPAARRIGRWEWALPLVALDALFGAFVALQAAVLLTGDKDQLLHSTGLTYAQYARQGFGQLCAATALVLLVLAVAVRKAPRETPRDRMLVRIVLGVLCGLTLVVVASALRRLGLYEDAYGFTRLRVWVHAFEFWLGLVVVLVMAAGVRLRGTWLPRAVAASSALVLLALAASNPDGLIAGHNADRFARTGKIDTAYLAGLSADAVPTLDRLPEPYRSCVLAPQVRRLGQSEPWYAANLGRARARAVLAGRPVATAPSCPPDPAARAGGEGQDPAAGR